MSIHHEEHHKHGEDHQGQGKGLGKGPGHGRHSGGGFGTDGFCICTKCGTRLLHEQGIQCTKWKCPNCGHTMIREALLNERQKNK